MSKYPLPEGVLVAIDERPAPGPIIVPLERPVREGNRELAELVVAPLRAAHVRRMPKTWETFDDLLAVAKHLVGLPDVVLEQLVGPDLGALSEAVGAQCWPLRDLPAQWAEVREELERRGLPPKIGARDVPESPRLDGPVELELGRELVTPTDTYSHLRFGEVTGKIAKGCGLAGLELARLPWLIEQLTGAPSAIVDQLEGVDLHRALALAQCFFSSTRPRPRT